MTALNVGFVNYPMTWGLQSRLSCDYMGASVDIGISQCCEYAIKFSRPKPNDIRGRVAQKRPASLDVVSRGAVFLVFKGHIAVVAK